MQSSLAPVSSDIIKACLPGGQAKPFPQNCFSLMVLTGAKGSMVNHSQVRVGPKSYLPCGFIKTIGVICSHSSELVKKHSALSKYLEGFEMMFFAFSPPWLALLAFVSLDILRPWPASS